MRFYSRTGTGRSISMLPGVTRQHQAAISTPARAAWRKSQVGGAERSERIRTYRFQEKIVVDHRLTGEHKSYPLGPVLDGDLDGILDALIARQQAEKLLQQSNT